MKELNQYTKEALKIMCSYVGADFDKIDFNEDFWFRKFTWTTEKEEQFKDELIKYWQTNRKARIAMTSLGYTTSKKRLDVPARFWICNYGWMLSD